MRKRHCRLVVIPFYVPPRFFTRHGSSNMSESYSTAEVAKHKDEANRMWIIVDTGVYDITGKSSHPDSHHAEDSAPFY